MKEYNIVDLMAQEGINDAIKRYGIEGCEEKIKWVYRNMPKLRDYMLSEYRKKLNFKKEK